MEAQVKERTPARSEGRNGMNYLGVDPGVGGGAVCVTTEFDGGMPPTVRSLKFKDKTEREIDEWFHALEGLSLAVIERVSSSPQMGVVSAFTFGRSYGFLRGMLIGYGHPFVEVSPQKWQKAMGCLSKGNKNVTKAKAQQLYPNEKITHAIADALLLATYCKQNYDQLF